MTTTLDPLKHDITQLGWESLPSVASNFDHVWERDIAEQLKAKPNAAYSQYAGWNFCGYVWHDGEKFNCQVWTYNSISSVVSADDGYDLMQQVSARYGAG